MEFNILIPAAAETGMTFYCFGLLLSLKLPILIRISKTSKKIFRVCINMLLILDYIKLSIYFFSFALLLISSVELCFIQLMYSTQNVIL